jgi:hypothetical protein
VRGRSRRRRGDIRRANISMGYASLTHPTLAGAVGTADAEIVGGEVGGGSFLAGFGR